MARELERVCPLASSVEVATWVAKAGATELRARVEKLRAFESVAASAADHGAIAEAGGAAGTARAEQEASRNAGRGRMLAWAE